MATNAISRKAEKIQESDLEVAHIPYIPLVQLDHMATPSCKEGWEM